MRIDGESTTRKELLTTREEQHALEECANITERLLKNKSVFILLEDGEILKIWWIRIKHTDGRFLAYFERDGSVHTRECKYSDLGIKWGFTEDALKNK